MTNGVLRLGADHEADAAFAGSDAAGGVVQEADGAFAADRAVDVAFREDGEAIGELGADVVIAPADERDDVDRVRIAQEAAGFDIRPARRLEHEG